MIIMPEEQRKNKKITFCGLDNSGKSSFIARLKHQEYPLRPTTGVEQTPYEIFGFPILLWDFGGQKKLRDSYENKEHFFDNTDLLFYIIDVQDAARYGESILYFEDTLKKFKKQKPFVFVCFHKADPDLAKSKRVLDNIQLLKNRLNIPLEDFQAFFFSTTIFDYYSVLTPFSFAIQKLLPFASMLEKFIANFFQAHHLSSIVLMDKNGAIVSKIARKTDEGERDLAYCQLTGVYLSQLFESYEKHLMTTPGISLRLTKEIGEEGSVGFILFEKIKVYEMRYYLILLSRELDQLVSIKENLPEFISGLVKSIEISF